MDEWSSRCVQRLRGRIACTSSRGEGGDAAHRPRPGGSNRSTGTRARHPPGSPLSRVRAPRLGRRHARSGHAARLAPAGPPPAASRGCSSMARRVRYTDGGGEAADAQARAERLLCETAVRGEMRRPWTRRECRGGTCSDDETGTCSPRDLFNRPEGGLRRASGSPYSRLPAARVRRTADAAAMVKEETDSLIDGLAAAVNVPNADC